MRNLSDSLLKFSIIIWNFIICRKNWNFLSPRRKRLVTKCNCMLFLSLNIYIYMGNSWYICISFTVNLFSFFYILFKGNLSSLSSSSRISPPLISSRERMFPTTISANFLSDLHFLIISGHSDIFSVVYHSRKSIINWRK